LSQLVIDSAIPDLRESPFELPAELRETALAKAIDLYRERLKADGLPLSSFSSGI
jgi:hypothetical protein